MFELFGVEGKVGLGFRQRLTLGPAGLRSGRHSRDVRKLVPDRNRDWLAALIMAVIDLHPFELGLQRCAM